jgi:tetratricopeptide (TPR) repeat protein
MALVADSLYRRGEHAESYRRLEAYLERFPGEYLAWVLSARDALVLGYATPDREEAKAWLRRSIEHAGRAKALQPGGVDGLYLGLAAKGQLSLIEGPRTRAQLGAQVAREARALLALDSTYASAHNALGRVYMEVASLSWMERLGARVLMGGDVVGQATWENAERHLRRAVELQPMRNYHVLDLGVLLVHRKRFEEARRVLEQALATPLEVPAQEGYRQDARRWLEKMREGGG